MIVLLALEVKNSSLNNSRRENKNTI